MKKHVWRPLYVVICLILLLFLMRIFYVPEDFGAQERGYTFGYHRLGNEQDWQDYPAKYRNTDHNNRYCNSCHDQVTETLSMWQHAMIPCENCHGAAFDHPQSPEKLTIDRSRSLCLRCHSQLIMPSSGRNLIPGIDPKDHNVGMECADCHNPHNPDLGEM